MDQEPQTEKHVSEGKLKLTLGKKLLFTTFVVLCVLVAGEIAIRIRQTIRYGTTEKTLYSFTKDEATGLRIPVPGYENGRIRINSLGFRGPEIEQPKPAGVIRVAFLGASTTFCAEASNNESTWPNLVIEALNRKYPDAKFDYVNASVPGYGVVDSSLGLEHRVRPLAPDVIIVYHAANDISRDTRRLAEQEGLDIGKKGAPSLLGKVSLAWYLIETNLNILAEQSQARSQDRTTLHVQPGSLSPGFHDRLRDLLLKSREVGSLIAVATFSAKIRKSQSPEEQIEASNTNLMYMPYMSVQGLLDLFEEYNGAIRSAATETGVILIEGEHEIPGTAEYFHDSVHFTDAGCRLMAERVLRALSASSAFADLVAPVTTASAASLK